MNKGEVENRIRELELELTNLKAALGEETFRKHTSFFRTIEDIIPSGISIIDDTGQQVYVNPSFCKMIGWEEKELLGKFPPFSYWPDEEIETINTCFRQALSHSAPKDGFDLIFCSKSGVRIPINLIVAPIVGESNRVFWLANIIDITGRRKAERILEDIIDKNPMSIQIVDREGYTIKVNNAFIKLFGSLPPGDFSIFEDYQLNEGGYGELIDSIKKGEIVHFPDMQYNVSNSISGFPDMPVWIRTIVFPLKDNAGNPERFVFMHENIIDRKKADLELENEKQRLSSILKGTNAGTWEWNIQSGEVIINELWADFIGYTLEELEPISIDTWTRFTHPDDLKRSDEILARHFSGELDYYECEIRMKHKNGEWIWIVDRGKVNKWDQLGKPLLMSGTHQDITIRKRAEEELKKKVDELAKANEVLEQYTFSNQELKQFAYTASHQLQEPIRTVSNYMQIIEEDYSHLLDSKALSYIHIVNDATVRMGLLINSLLDFSRIGRNKKLTRVNCKTLIDNVIADLAYMISTSNTTIEVGEMPVLNIYEAEVRQLFQNLITNAVKFQEKGNKPRIMITSEKINNTWKFSVRDNGIGINQIHFDQIFDIFQRLHINEEIYEGKGIGLTYCKKIVQLHKGKIWLDSTVGKGTTFHFTIESLTE